MIVYGHQICHISTTVLPRKLYQTIERDLTCVGNWRGITLFCMPGKIMEKIIIRGLKDQVDAKLRR